MKKEKTIKAHQRRLKNGKVITVHEHKASYDAAEAMKEALKKKGAGGELEALKKKGNSLDDITAYAKKHGYVVKRDGTFGYKGGSKRIQWTATREEIKRAMKKKSRKGSIAAAIERDFPGIK